MSSMHVMRTPGHRRAVGALLAALAVALVVGCGTSPTPSPSTVVTPVPPSSTPVPSVAVLPSATPSPSPSPSPSSTPVHEDLSGIPTTPELAHRYPIAVMLDDSPAGRPQAGLSAASIVWQAPAEGGIPRYMAIFQSGSPGRIGPVRSARLYFVRWASEWKSVYLHSGGPPPLKAFLAGRQQLVVDVNGRATSRVSFRRAPHNLYSTGRRIRTFAENTLHATADRLGYDASKPGVLYPFRDGAPLDARGPDGGTIRVTYTSERVSYRYDRETNTWLRSVDGKDQRDPLDTPNGGYEASATGPRIAPTTVVVMVVPIRRSAAIEGPALGRLEADSIGSNKAWVFADGRVIAGTWKKRTPTDRTRFYAATGTEIVLPRGQLFIQAIPKTSAFSFKVEAAR